MASELREAPETVARQEQVLAAPLRELVGQLLRHPPALVLTCARGSSGHAASFAKHCIEKALAIPVASAAPSIVTVYRRDLRLKGALFLAVSQSGRSDDLIEQARSAERSGALTVALVNDTASPLATSCRWVLPMAAGEEIGIAATKSFVTSLSAILRLTAAWSGDAHLQDAIQRLPERLAAASGLDWAEPSAALKDANSMMVVGRGPTLAIACEAALKLKEVCRVHAEAFSGAEFLHGPVTLAGPGYPVLVLMPGDAAAEALRGLAADLRRKQALVLAADTESELPVLAPDQPEADAVCLVQSFYAMAVRLAALRGLDANKPAHLQKVTRTR